MSETPRKPFIEHLEDLRRCLIVSGAAVFLCALGSYPLSDTALAWLTAPLRQGGSQVYFFSPPEAFLMRLKVAFMAGILIALPVVLMQIWIFVSPGLHRKEKRHVLPWVFFSAALATTGAVFAFKGVLPLALKFLLGFQTDFLKPMISVSHYIGFALGVIGAFAVAFNLPCVVVAAVASGLVTVKTLTKFRRHVYTGVFVLAMVLTPPDIISQLLLGLPLIVLFEVSLIVSRFVKS